MKNLLILLLACSSMVAMAKEPTNSIKLVNPVTVENNTGENIVLHGDNEANFTFNNGASYTAPSGTVVNYYGGSFTSSNAWGEISGQDTWHGYWVHVTPLSVPGVLSTPGLSGSEGVFYAGTAGNQQIVDYQENAPNTYVLTPSPL